MIEETLPRPPCQPFERRAEASLREHANLLDLTHDAMIVRDMEASIKYWNRGAEEMYGWTAEEALGQSAPELLKTVSAVPLEQIESQVLRTGRWEGELVHHRRNGTPVVVASRLALQRDERGEAGGDPRDQYRHHPAQAGRGGPAGSRGAMESCLRSESHDVLHHRCGRRDPVGESRRRRAVGLAREPADRPAGAERVPRSRSGVRPGKRRAGFPAARGA